MDPQALTQSTSSLNNISRSFNGLAAAITRSSFLSRSIAKTVKADNILKKKLITSDSTFFKRRRESFLRRKREDQIEAQSVNGAVKAKGKAITNTGKGVLGRILNFLGFLLIGFVVQRLPQILKGITALIKRINQVVQIFKGFINGIINVFDSMSARLDQVLGMVRFFDFDKQKEDAEDAFQNVNDKLKNLNTSFIAGVNRYQNDRDLDEEIERIESESEQKDKFFGGTDDPGASNQWWDFLDMFPNKNKTEGENNEDGEKDDIKEDVKNEVLTYFEGGEIKAGQTALVGEGKDGKSKDRELFVPKQDGFILPNNITEKFLEASSFLESKKLSSLKIGKEYDVNNPPNRGNYDRTVTGFKEFTKDYKQWVKDNPLGTKFGQKVEPSVEPSDSMIESLKSVGDSLKPQMESVANELKEVIDTPEMQKTITNVKKSMQGVLKEITPKRKGQTIMMPAPQGGQSKSSGGGGGAALPPPSTSGAVSGGVNIKEYHKHLTTLVTSYT